MRNASLQDPSKKCHWVYVVKGSTIAIYFLHCGYSIETFLGKENWVSEILGQECVRFTAIKLKTWGVHRAILCWYFGVRDQQGNTNDDNNVLAIFNRIHNYQYERGGIGNQPFYGYVGGSNQKSSGMDVNCRGKRGCSQDRLIRKPDSFHCPSARPNDCCWASPCMSCGSCKLAPSLSLRTLSWADVTCASWDGMDPLVMTNIT